MPDATTTTTATITATTATPQELEKRINITNNFPLIIHLLNLSSPSASSTKEKLEKLTNTSDVKFWALTDEEIRKPENGFSPEEATKIIECRNNLVKEGWNKLPSTNEYFLQQLFLRPQTIERYDLGMVEDITHSEVKDIREIFLPKFTDEEKTKKKEKEAEQLAKFNEEAKSGQKKKSDDDDTKDDKEKEPKPQYPIPGKDFWNKFYFSTTFNFCLEGAVPTRSTSAWAKLSLIHAAIDPDLGRPRKCSYRPRHFCRSANMVKNLLVNLRELKAAGKMTKEEILEGERWATETFTMWLYAIHTSFRRVYVGSRPSRHEDDYEAYTDEDEEEVEEGEEAEEEEEEEDKKKKKKNSKKKEENKKKKQEEKKKKEKKPKTQQELDDELEEEYWENEKHGDLVDYQIRDTVSAAIYLFCEKNSIRNFSRRAELESLKTLFLSTNPVDNSETAKQHYERMNQLFREQFPAISSMTKYEVANRLVLFHSITIALYKLTQGDHSASNNFSTPELVQAYVDMGFNLLFYSVVGAIRFAEIRPLLWREHSDDKEVIVKEAFALVTDGIIKKEAPAEEESKPATDEKKEEAEKKPASITSWMVGAKNLIDPYIYYLYILIEVVTERGYDITRRFIVPEMHDLIAIASRRMIWCYSSAEWIAGCFSNFFDTTIDTAATVFNSIEVRKLYIYDIGAMSTTAGSTETFFTSIGLIVKADCDFFVNKLPSKRLKSPADLAKTKQQLEQEELEMQQKAPLDDLVETVNHVSKNIKSAIAVAWYTSGIARLVSGMDCNLRQAVRISTDEGYLDCIFNVLPKYMTTSESMRNYFSLLYWCLKQLQRSGRTDPEMQEIIKRYTSRQVAQIMIDTHHLCIDLSTKPAMWWMTFYAEASCFGQAGFQKKPKLEFTTPLMRKAVKVVGTCGKDDENTINWIAHVNSLWANVDLIQPPPDPFFATRMLEDEYEREEYYRKRREGFKTKF